MALPPIRLLQTLGTTSKYSLRVKCSIRTIRYYGVFKIGGGLNKFRDKGVTMYVRMYIWTALVHNS